MSQSNKKRWKFMCAIRDMILEHDGMIFGGFVRDSLIHDHFAREFYKLGRNLVWDYMDPAIDPATADRLLIPHDIDAYMTQKDFEDLTSTLQANRVHIRVAFVRSPDNYITNQDVSDPTLKHYRLSVSIDLAKVTKALAELPVDLGSLCAPSDVKLDIITSVKAMEEPFLSRPDFECNALYMTKHGISLSRRVFTKRLKYDHELHKNRVMRDIIERRTRYLNPDPDSEASNERMISRIRRMFLRNWVIQDDLMTLVAEDDYPGHCIICHGLVGSHHFKLHCCDGRYHGHCLQAAMSTGTSAMRFTNRCFVCKSHLASSESNLPYLVSRCPI
jgi:hypothetical protein